ncbi:MAG: HemK/PrmC family methyltransferase [Acidimicrobiales bacterium]
MSSTRSPTPWCRTSGPASSPAGTTSGEWRTGRRRHRHLAPDRRTGPRHAGPPRPHRGRARRAPHDRTGHRRRAHRVPRRARPARHGPHARPLRCHGGAARHRRALQYVLGRWAFRHLDLLVDRRVLIPRPETETVVDIALREIDRLVDTYRYHYEQRLPVVDLGTGSGAIALAVATERTSTDVWGTDVSEDAVAVARANLAGAGRAAARVALRTGSWFEALPAELAGTIGVIISNPPYVAEADELPDEVERWEPAMALRSGPDGLDAARVLIGTAGRWLRPDGALVLELAPGQLRRLRTRPAGRLQHGGGPPRPRRPPALPGGPPRRDAAAVTASLWVYAAVGAVAAVVTWLLVPLTQRLAAKVGAVVEPDERRIHRWPTPPSVARPCSVVSSPRWPPPVGSSAGSRPSSTAPGRSSASSSPRW